MLNKSCKCLGCHRKIEKEYFFCSITCACLAGFMAVRTDIKPERDWSELENQEFIDEFLNNSPVRGDYPDKDKYL